MKVAELTGGLLDAWVARACGGVVDGVRNEICIVGTYPNRHVFSPSSNWGDGGPIIEADQISIEFGCNQHCFPGWSAIVGSVRYEQDCDARGPTPLIAAMRAKVASHYGDEVPDEEKL